jgi:hypothetical protein
VGGLVTVGTIVGLLNLVAGGTTAGFAGGPAETGPRTSDAATNADIAMEKDGRSMVSPFVNPLFPSNMYMSFAFGSGQLSGSALRDFR